MPTGTDANFLQDRYLRKVIYSFLSKTSAKDDDIKVGEERRWRSSGEYNRKLFHLASQSIYSYREPVFLKRI